MRAASAASAGAAATCCFALCAAATGSARAQQEPLPGEQQARAPSPFDNLNLWGYGELEYSRPVHRGDRAEADLRRAVFGIGYRFSPAVTFNSEYEVEHAVASATDPGEFEVEQFYLDFAPAGWVTVSAGLFLMPFGIVNEHHEPAQFFGVQRNYVETLIIPSTWREGGVSAHGNTDFGFGWSVGVVTGFDLSKWEYAPAYPPYQTAFGLQASGVAPLQAVHQELARANASHLSGYLALNYHGVSGLLVGAAATTGTAVRPLVPQGSPDPGEARVSLWEAHARWTPGRLDLTALWAGGAIDGAELANSANPSSPNPIPTRFHGGYLQAAYSAWERGTLRLAPFVRWESYDLSARYDGSAGPVLPAGAVPVSAAPGDTGTWPQGHDHVWTFGASLFVTPQVVVKADYQWFRTNPDLSCLNLGLGLQF